MKFIHSLIKCVLLLFPFAAISQQQSDYYVRQYGTEDGLPSNGVKGMQWVPETGFLWIATEAGMVRFNGMGFRVFTHDDEPHITNERILYLLRNNKGEILTQDNTGNSFRVEKNQLVFLGKRSVDVGFREHIAKVAVSEKFGSYPKGPAGGIFGLQTDRIVPLSDTSLLVNHAGTVSFFSASMSLPEPVNIPGPKVISLFKIKEQAFVISAGGIAWLLDSTHFFPEKVPIEFSDGRVKTDFSKSRFIWENGMQNPILFDKDQAWEIHWQNRRLYASIIAEKVPQDVLIRYAQYDRTYGILFIGTDSKGIIIIRKNRVRAIKKERSGPEERTSYYSQLELPGNRVLTNEGHILGENDLSPREVPFRGGFENNTFLEDDSLFWFIGRPGAGISCLHRYNLRTKNLTAFPKIGRFLSQTVIAKSQGDLYLVNQSGIMRMKSDSVEWLYLYPNKDRQKIHFDVKETAPGVLSIANCSQLLQFHIATGQMDTLYNAGNYCVRTIWVHNEYLFFGTYGNGLFVSKNGVVRPLPLDKNNYLRFTHCFIDDGNGFCWISTNRGLFKTNIAELINAYETGAPQVYYHYFGRNDGMDMTEMNGGCTPCGLIMKNQTISFPTMEGLLWVNPATAIPFLPSGEIFTDEIQAGGHRIEFREDLATMFETRGRDILIRLGFSAWCNRENIYLQYRLNNEADWKNIDIDNGATIQLNNLRRGDYVLRIRKLNGFGINNYVYREIHFKIPTPWHQQGWFFLLVLAAIWSVLVLYFRYRTRQLKQRQKKLEQLVVEKTRELQEQNAVLEKNNSIKTRLISIISHDIVTPLKFLTAAGKNLLGKRKMMPEELQQETIEEMTNTSQELHMLSTNILNWIKYQNENRRMQKETFNLRELITQVLGILQSLARQQNLVICNEVDPAIEITQFYEPLKILVYNLLTNSIRFSEKGSIWVDATILNDTVTLSVRDEGTGMTPEQVQRLMEDEVVITAANVDNKRGHGLGFLIIKDLVKTMGAELRIESKKEAGTTVFVKIPVNQTGRL